MIARAGGVEGMGVVCSNGSYRMLVLCRMLTHPLPDGAGRLIRSEDAFARGRQSLGGRYELLAVCAGVRVALHGERGV